MVYVHARANACMDCSEVDPPGSLWYTSQRAKRAFSYCSEVDPTGSLWYTELSAFFAAFDVLKLTLPGHYGIKKKADAAGDNPF